MNSKNVYLAHMKRNSVLISFDGRERFLVMLTHALAVEYNYSYKYITTHMMQRATFALCIGTIPTFFFPKEHTINFSRKILGIRNTLKIKIKQET